MSVLCAFAPPLPLRGHLRPQCRVQCMGSTFSTSRQKRRPRTVVRMNQPSAAPPPAPDTVPSQEKNRVPGATSSVETHTQKATETTHQNLSREAVARRSGEEHSKTAEPGLELILQDARRIANILGSFIRRKKGRSSRGARSTAGSTIASAYVSTLGRVERLSERVTVSLRNVPRAVAGWKPLTAFEWQLPGAGVGRRGQWVRRVQKFIRSERGALSGVASVVGVLLATAEAAFGAVVSGRALGSGSSRAGIAPGIGRSDRTMRGVGEFDMVTRASDEPLLNTADVARGVRGKMRDVVIGAKIPRPRYMHSGMKGFSPVTERGRKRSGFNVATGTKTNDVEKVSGVVGEAKPVLREVSGLVTKVKNKAVQTTQAVTEELALAAPQTEIDRASNVQGRREEGSDAGGVEDATEAREGDPMAPATHGPAADLLRVVKERWVTASLLGAGAVASVVVAGGVPLLAAGSAVAVTGAAVVGAGAEVDERDRARLHGLFRRSWVVQRVDAVRKGEPMARAGSVVRRREAGVQKEGEPETVVVADGVVDASSYAVGEAVPAELEWPVVGALLRWLDEFAYGSEVVWARFAKRFGIGLGAGKRVDDGWLLLSAFAKGEDQCN